MLTTPSEFHCFGELELGPWPALAHVWGPGTWAEIIAIVEPQSRQITLLDFAGSFFWPKKVQKYFSFIMDDHDVCRPEMQYNTGFNNDSYPWYYHTFCQANSVGDRAAKSFVGIWVEALWAILCFMCWICNFLIWRWDRRFENFDLGASPEVPKWWLKSKYISQYLSWFFHPEATMFCIPYNTRVRMAVFYKPDYNRYLYSEKGLYQY